MIFKNINKIKTFLLIIIILPYLNSCGIYRKVDAKEYPPEPEKRIKKNMEEGRGLRLFGNKKKGGVFDFASSNSLWRASLDTIDFMPLLTADYGGGIIVTDWFTGTEDANKAIKISIQFLTNEIRADALNIKVFKKNCDTNKNCKIINSEGALNSELKLAILKKAAVYESEKDTKDFKEYDVVTIPEAKN
jgi:hypothetical protein|tara:strand:- start:2566 stop:3135 length:570 start_codon:yes stop_codon:yes gene_type:complete